MTKRTWIIFIAVVVVLFGALLFAQNKSNIDVSNVNANSVVGASEDSGNIADHVFGKKDSKVVLTEYGDYQCPGCGSAYQPIKTVTEKYELKMAFVFRNFPLPTLHPNARAAAASAEAAGINGKYWEMHDKLYSSQSEWQSASATDRTQQFTSYATEIGVDANAFTKTLNDKAKQINQKIDFDQALGKKIGVDGTPTFFLNGKKVDQYFKDGKIVPQGTDGAEPVWSDADAMDKLILQPAFKEAGISITSSKK